MRIDRSSPKRNTILTPTYYEQYTTAMNQALRGLEITGADGESLGSGAGFERFCDLSRKVRNSGRKQYLCDNGTSAAFASHIALDWTNNGGISLSSHNPKTKILFTPYFTPSRSLIPERVGFNHGVHRIHG